MNDNKLEELKSAFNSINCTLKKHSDVIEITFENDDDADWFQDNFEKFQKESAVCCLMPMRPKNAPPKFIFNVKDIEKFIVLIKMNNNPNEY